MLPSASTSLSAICDLGGFLYTVKHPDGLNTLQTCNRVTRVARPTMLIFCRQLIGET